MKTWMSLITTAGFLAGMLVVQSCSTKANGGPNGGDLVTLDAGKSSAEVVANADTGEVMVHTWTEDLKSPLPIAAKPLTLGAEQSIVRLDPHPMPGDPPGFCSRFYGRADWVRGGGVHHGWMSRAGSEAQRQHFDWNHCWKAGRTHGQMWSEMGGHGPGMRQGGHEGMRHMAGYAVLQKALEPQVTWRDLLIHHLWLVKVMKAAVAGRLESSRMGPTPHIQAARAGTMSGLASAQTAGPFCTDRLSAGHQQQAKRKHKSMKAMNKKKFLGAGVAITMAI